MGKILTWDPEVPVFINRILFLTWDPEETLWPFSQLSVVSSFKLGLIKLISFKKSFLLKAVGIQVKWQQRVLVHMGGMDSPRGKCFLFQG